MLIKGSAKSFCTVIAMLILTLFLILTCVHAASDKQITSKPAQKPAQSAAAKPAVKVEPLYGGNLRIIRMSGPGTPFGIPWETVGLDSAAATPVLEYLMRSRRRSNKRVLAGGRLQVSGKRFSRSMEIKFE